MKISLLPDVVDVGQPVIHDMHKLPCRIKDQQAPSRARKGRRCTEWVGYEEFVLLRCVIVIWNRLFVRFFVAFVGLLRLCSPMVERIACASLFMAFMVVASIPWSSEDMREYR